MAKLHVIKSVHSSENKSSCKKIYFTVNVTCSRPQQTATRPGVEPGIPQSVVRGANHCPSPPQYKPYRSEIHMSQPAFCICQNKDTDQLPGSLHGNGAADQPLCFLSVLSIYLLNPKFQVSNHFLWLYSSVCVEPGQKPRRQVFSCCNATKPVKSPVPAK